MDLLENELVLKYFGCRVLCSEAHFTNMAYDEHERCISTRVLQSMQEPIIEGTKYLAISQQRVMEFLWGGEGEYTGFHPYMLCLPDRFQKQECECICHNTKENHGCCEDMNKPKPSPEKER